MGIKNFTRERELQWKNGKVVRPSGYTENLEKLYGEYLATLPADERPPHRDHFVQQVEGYLKTQFEKSKQDYLDTMNYETVLTPDELVVQAMELQQFEICAKGEQITQEGINATLEDLEVGIIHHNNHYSLESKGPDGKNIRPVFTTDVIRNTIKQFIRDRKKKTIKDLKSDLAFRADYEGPAHQHLEYILGLYNPVGDAELSLYALKQWMWQVKRYLMGGNVRDPLMINIMGEKQGTGKTQLVRNLSKPLKEFTQESTLAQVSDLREAESWSTNYIIFFDELSLGGLDPKEFSRTIATFKSLLTTETISHRVMRTTKQSKSNRTFSAIGTSNETLVSVIFDSTGMRRFFELVIDCGPSPERMEAVFNMPVLSIWKGINENLEQGYIPHGSDIHRRLVQVQSTYKRFELLDRILQDKDYGQSPVLSDDGRVSEILEKCQEAKTPKQLNEVLNGTEITPLTMTQIQRELYDWTKDSLSLDETRYLPKGTKLIDSLKRRKYAIVFFSPTDPRVLTVASTPGENINNVPGGI